MGVCDARGAFSVKILPPKTQREQGFMISFLKIPRKLFHVEHSGVDAATMDVCAIFSRSDFVKNFRSSRSLARFGEILTVKEGREITRRRWEDETKLSADGTKVKRNYPRRVKI